MGTADDVGTTYAFDDAGYVGEIGTPTGNIALEYDGEGNLFGAQTAATSIWYTTDALGRRVRRFEAGVEDVYLYRDALNPVAAVRNGVLRDLYVYADRQNVPSAIIRFEPNGSIEGEYWVISDIRGSVRRVIDARCALVHGPAADCVAQDLDYDPYGRVIFDTSPGFQPFGFAGGLYEPATGLVRFGARDYDARTSRWLAKDPIGFAGGDWDLYAYAYGDPVNLVDLTGEAPILIVPVVFAGAMGVGWVTERVARAFGSRGGGDYNTDGVSEAFCETGEAVAWAAAGVVLPELAGAWWLRRMNAIVPVSRWGRPGLQSGDWVMTGSVSPLNYVLSGKFQPRWVYGRNIPAAYSTGSTYFVRRGSLRWPMVEGRFLGPLKAVLGQRIYLP